MDDVRVAGPVRPNLRAGRLTAYTFSVETAIGRNPMRYLLARGFDGERPTRATTVLFVLQPAVLSGTYVRIEEDKLAGRCQVHTFLPTMAAPLPVAEPLTFDCLPLTDVSYLDLMAWSHPALRPVETTHAEDRNLDGSAAVAPDTRHYLGPPSLPTLEVTEFVDLDRGLVSRRLLRRDGQPLRTWEITEHGGAGGEEPPRRIEVCRSRTGHRTEFIRTSPAVALPDGVFTQPPMQLRHAAEERLDRR
ncbi:hypothetical protein [Micromonospora sp. NPDC000442]|uniref:hypothetical protein n=1 Tax=Micromonospora sp. NPDC000442 TaxID=3364217 RepID=UPI0036D0BB96